MPAQGSQTGSTVVARLATPLVRLAPTRALATVEEILLEDPVPGWRTPRSLSERAPSWSLSGWYGSTLDALVRRLHGGVAERRWMPVGVPITGRASRLREVDRDTVLRLLAQVAASVAAAHRRGVYHGALHPRLIRVDEELEVRVAFFGAAWRVDWKKTIESDRPWPHQHTASLRFISPDLYRRAKQRRGRGAGPGARHPQPADDVYSLGALLYFILTGTAPYEGHPAKVRRDLRGEGVEGASMPQPVRGRAQLRPDAPAPPEELARLCDDAMRAVPSADEFLRRLDEWLKGPGATSTLDAEALLGELTKKVVELKDRWAEAHALAEEAQITQTRAAPWSGPSDKLAGWICARQSAVASLEAERFEEDLIGELREFRGRAGVDVRARLDRLLLECYRQQHAEGERRKDGRLLRRARIGLDAFLSPHERAEGRQVGLELRFHMPCHHLEVATYKPFDLASAQFPPRTYRALEFDPSRTPGLACRWELGPRQTIPDQSGARVSLRLPVGDHIIFVHDSQGQALRLPVRLREGGTAGFVPPAAETPALIPLISQLDLRPGEQYIAPGWFMTGGDEGAVDHLPGRRCWLDGFVIQTLPVRRQQYADFLNARMREGRTQLVDACMPAPSTLGGYKLAQFEDRWQQHEKIVPLEPDMPITLISWHAAREYAAWLAEVDGRPWRLPWEHEWEKAAGGPFGWIYPWGDLFDPTWTRMAQSVEHGGYPRPVSELEGLVDESPYGVFGMAGGVMIWCQDPFSPLPPLQDQWAVPPRGESDPRFADEVVHKHLRMIRGASFLSPPVQCRIGSRFAQRPESANPGLGIRLVRSISFDDGG
ncbi:MAG: SUMF1/EgtB/PvdO family nonheme iron enzyme [Myxococcales bacterium]|nr:SUMF1/EgtB/PvdO family nonheme iron enzyme [Myxococcales bacterium]